MFADLFHAKSPRAAADYDHAFVKSVEVRRSAPRDPKVERFIAVCWGLIAVKHIVVIWAVHHYPIPFNQLWINFPTFLLGLLATAAYYLRD